MISSSLIGLFEGRIPLGLFRLRFPKFEMKKNLLRKRTFSASRRDLTDGLGVALESLAHIQKGSVGARHEAHLRTDKT